MNAMLLLTKNQLNNHHFGMLWFVWPSVMYLTSTYAAEFAAALNARPSERFFPFAIKTDKTLNATSKSTIRRILVSMLGEG